MEYYIHKANEEIFYAVFAGSDDVFHLCTICLYLVLFNLLRKSLGPLILTSPCQLA